MNNLKFHIGLILCLIFTGIQAKEYNILDFGAKPDGQTINTQAIQSAIGQLSEISVSELTGTMTEWIFRIAAM